MNNEQCTHDTPAGVMSFMDADTGAAVAHVLTRHAAKLEQAFERHDKDQRQDSAMALERIADTAQQYTPKTKIFHDYGEHQASVSRAKKAIADLHRRIADVMDPPQEATNVD